VREGRFVIKAVIFDFGGVMAEEGFREGLKVIAIKNSLDPDEFFKTAEDLIHKSGYLTGMADEKKYWNSLRQKTGIKGSDKELRKEILERFVLRLEMLEYVKKIKTSGFITAILSDQTDWLDEINAKTPFYHYFDHVFNSFNIKKSKRDPSVFRDVCSSMKLNPDEAVFVDDNPGYVKRASGEGLKIILFTNADDFAKEMKKCGISLGTK
jgi:putative hydrolase of the HAD superfamily